MAPKSRLFPLIMGLRLGMMGFMCAMIAMALISRQGTLIWIILADVAILAVLALIAIEVWRSHK